MIEFQKAYQTKKSFTYIKDCLEQQYLSSDGLYTKKCYDWLSNKLNVKDILMTTSCTHALELALQCISLTCDDEVIVPSFTYPSTANAVLMAGGKVVFSQVLRKDLTLDPALIEEKITANTKAIIVVHYGGQVCAMTEIMAIAKAHNLYVIEDSAQSFLSTYKGEMAGTIGDFGCYSFHGTKDVVAGEGGALVINNQVHKEACEIFRNKGTNREAFLRNEVDFYEWVGKGSSYGPSDILMALLFSQLEVSETIIRLRQVIRARYVDHFTSKAYGLLETYSQVHSEVINNGHMFYMIFKDPLQGQAFRAYMKDRGIMVYTHFVPLHSSQYGSQYCRDKDVFDLEKDLGKRLVRLPLYPDLSEDEQREILACVDEFMVEVSNDFSGDSYL